jgi:sugar lactone lactonase YvrE
MAERTPTIVLEGLAFPEGPRWHEGHLVFSDQHDRRVVRMDTAGAAETVVEVPQQPSGLGWLPDGRMLISSMLDRRVLRFDGAELVEHADLSGLATGQCNDMVVDGQGRAYVGNFGFDMYGGEAARDTCIVLVEADGSTRIAADAVAFPNGTVITDDGSTLIVGESYGGRLTAFTIAGDGTLVDRRLFAQLRGAVPDGICLDAEGAVWVACPLTGRCLHVRDGGDVLDEIEVNGEFAYACMLGGDDRRTLYICTAASSDPKETRTLRSGRIEAIAVDVPGSGRP